MIPGSARNQPMARKGRRWASVALAVGISAALTHVPWSVKGFACSVLGKGAGCFGPLRSGPGRGGRVRLQQAGREQEVQGSASLEAGSGQGDGRGDRRLSREEIKAARVERHAARDELRGLIKDEKFAENLLSLVNRSAPGVINVGLSTAILQKVCKLSKLSIFGGEKPPWFDSEDLVRLIEIHIGLLDPLDQAANRKDSGHCVSVTGSEIIPALEDHYLKPRLENTVRWVASKGGIPAKKFYGELLLLPTFQESRFLELYSSKILKEVSKYSLDGIATIAMTYAKVQVFNADLMQALGDEFIRKFFLATQQSMVTMVEAYQLLNYRHAPLFGTIANALAMDIRGFEVEDLATLARCFAQMRYQNQDLARAMAMTMRVRQLKASDAMHLARFFFLSGELQKDFTRETVEVFLSTAEDEYTGKDLATVAGIFSQMETHTKAEQEALDRANDVLMKRMESGDQEPGFFVDVAATAQALNWKDETVLDALGKRAADTMDAFNMQDTAAIVSAYGMMGARHEELFQAVGDHAPSHLDEINGQGMEDISWTFATTNFKHEVFIASMRQWAKDNRKSLRTPTLAILAWVSRKFYESDDEFYEVLTNQSTAKRHFFTVQDLARLAWGLHEVLPANHELMYMAYKKGLMMASKLPTNYLAMIFDNDMRHGDALAKAVNDGARSIQKFIDRVKNPRNSNLQVLLDMVSKLPPEDQPEGMLDALMKKVGRAPTNMAP